MKARFTLYGVEHTMELGVFTAMMVELCKAVTNQNINWKAFCEKEISIIEIN